MDSELLIALHTQSINSWNWNQRASGSGLEISTEPAPRREVPILDSIAHVLVSKASGEAIACGMQLDQKKQETIITIASNGVISPSTIHHLEDLWHKLKKTAELLHQSRLSRHGKNDFHGAQRIASRSSGRDHAVFSNEQSQKIRDFGRTVYIFCQKKLSQRIHQEFQGHTSLHTFCNMVEDLKGDDGLLSRYLLFISCGLKYVSKRLLEIGRGNEERVTDRFMNYMFGIYEKVRNIRKNDALRHQLSLIGSSSNFSILKYLKKVASLHSCINNLLKLAHSSRRRRRYLVRNTLCVRVLHNPERPIKLPQSENGWKVVVQGATEKHEWEVPEDLKIQAGREISDRFKGKDEISAFVHCECMIALHFIRRNDSEPPPISYIGLSHRPCLACRFFLRCLRNTGFGMVTTGGHSRTEFPWKYPTEEVRATGLPRSVCNSIHESFLSSVLSSYTSRLRMTSSVTSGN